MTADCRDDKDIKKQFMRQNAGQEVLICTFMDVLFGVIHTRTQLKNLLSVLVTH